MSGLKRRRELLWPLSSRSRVSFTLDSHKPVSPTASFSVSTSVMYLKSMHETISLGSWIDTGNTRFSLWLHPGYTSSIYFFLSVTHHVNKQLPQRLWKDDDNRWWVIGCHMYSGHCDSMYCMCVLLLNNVRTLPSALAHRSHTAFRTAAVARWITPFSGPSCLRWDETNFVFKVFKLSFRDRVLRCHWIQPTQSLTRTLVIFSTFYLSLNCFSLQNLVLNSRIKSIHIKWVENVFVLT